MKYAFSLFCYLFATLLPAQDVVGILKQNAVSLGDLHVLSDSIYEVISPYDVIMVGEMHGTREPALLVGALARLIADKEKSVSVVLEIPDAKMNIDRNRIDSLGLLRTIFFAEENIDGRNGEAWFQLVLQCARDRRIKLFFMDNPASADRDYGMYLEVKRAREFFPENKILTLSGNIHNRTSSSPGDKKMGTYVFEDHQHFDPTKIMSINHLYQEGTMMNNTGNGLELRTVQYGDSLLSTTVPYENYFCKTFLVTPTPYNFFFFTRKVTHSAPLQH